ncbi:hypothetical protein [Streptomyces sp. LUP47B]|uniref:hypothetical protein n=1 Tax=Streptomyces sp. LUP47B TaxID=1890286 RepID=UPI0008518A52|nr:hypothetical protein [Streptomyces sp. LUP47B]
MSDTKKHVNSELPDQDALAAFATSALGPGRRRRRAQAADSAAPASGAPAVDDAAQDPEKEAEQAAPDAATEAPTTPVAAAKEPEPDPEPAARPEPSAPAPAATVPTPTRAPDTEPTASPRVEEAAPAAPGREVDVRAVSVPSTRTPVPPGLQGGPVEVRVPALGPAGVRATQCTVMVSNSVRDRFAHYQLAKKMAGEKEPSNALVVRRAFLYCKRKDLFVALLTDVYQQNNAVDEEDYDEDGMLGEVVDRRVVRGRLKDSGQQSFRPSEQELVTYDAYSQAYGFPSRSDFLGAVLDAFLPQLPAAGRRK